MAVGGGFCPSYFVVIVMFDAFLQKQFEPFLGARVKSNKQVTSTLLYRRVFCTVSYRYIYIFEFVF